MEKIEKEWHDNDDSMSLTEVLYEYIRYWKWFILSVIVCLAVGIGFVLVSQKQYKSSLSVLLNEDKNTGRSSSSGFSLDELGMLSATNNIDNEIAILTSPDLMRGVVDSLNLQTTYFTRNKYFRNTEIYGASPFCVVYKGKTDKEKDLSGHIVFYIEKSGAEDYSVSGKYIIDKDNEFEINKSIKEFPAEIYLPDSIGKIHISLTGKEALTNEKYFVTISNTMSVINSLCGSLTVTQTTKASSALNLNLLVNNAEKGATILKELVRQYNAQNVKVNNEIAYNTAIFINARLKEIAIELGDVEKEVVDYKQQQRIADLASEAQMSVQQSGQNRERLMEIETQLGVVNMVDKFVNDPANRLRVIPNLGVSDPTLSQIISEYNNKVLNSDALLKNTGEENPTRKMVVEELINMHKSITGSLANVKRAYSINRQDMQRLSGSTLSRIRSIPQQEKGLLERVRQQQVKESLFLFLMQKREETNISIASISDKARIIASPQLTAPQIAPKVNNILLVSLILGCLIPVVVIYTINLLRTKIKNRTELEKLSVVTIAGQVGVNKQKDQVVVRPDENSTISEMFRTLRNNLNFMLGNKYNRVILITSADTGEGKTFLSVNLAMTYALTGKRVLLIGADIRKPKLDEYFNLKEKKGLTNFLADTNEDYRDYIHNSGLHFDLDIILSGVIPPNPNELLMSPKFEMLITAVKKEYDIILLDTAPVGLVSDTYQICQYADLTLFVVREGTTHKSSINFINIQKRENRLKNMYLVLNASSLDNNYGYKYGYGKGYGYKK